MIQVLKIFEITFKKNRSYRCSAGAMDTWCLTKMCAKSIKSIQQQTKVNVQPKIIDICLVPLQIKNIDMLLSKLKDEQFYGLNIFCSFPWKVKISLNARISENQVSKIHIRVYLPSFLMTWTTSC